MAKQDGWWRIRFFGGYEAKANLREIAYRIEDGTVGEKVFEAGVGPVGWDLETDVPVDGIDLDFISHQVLAGVVEGEIVATDNSVE